MAYTVSGASGAGRVGVRAATVAEARAKAAGLRGDGFADVRAVDLDTGAALPDAAGDPPAAPPEALPRTTRGNARDRTARR